MKGIVDRIEEGIVIVEVDKKMLEFPLANNDINEGDVVYIDTDSGLIEVDKEKTMKRKEKVSALFDRLKK